MATFLGPLLTALVVHAALAGAAPAPRSTFTHTRALTGLTSQLIARAQTRVPSIRAQMAALERTDVFVYVSHQISFSPNEPRAFVRFVTAAGGRRYLQVTINWWMVSEATRLQMLGHELQHALEIAAVPGVRNDRTLVELYRQIGYEVRPGQFETRAAQAMTDRVGDELARRHRRGAL